LQLSVRISLEICSVCWKTLCHTYFSTTDATAHLE